MELSEEIKVFQRFLCICVFSWKCVLVHVGCCNNHGPGGLSKETYFSWFWKWKSKMEVPAGSVSG